MTTKKELFLEHGNTIIASAHLTNSSGVIIHYMDHNESKLLLSIVSGDKILSTHYVKYNNNGGFRLGTTYFNLSDFIRSNY